MMTHQSAGGPTIIVREITSRPIENNVFVAVRGHGFRYTE
jgi:hypothetical protein